jgi:hypothetical protein
VGGGGGGGKGVAKKEKIHTYFSILDKGFKIH